MRNEHRQREDAMPHDHLSMGILATCPICQAQMEAEALVNEHPSSCPGGLKHRIEFDFRVREDDDAEPRS